MTLAAVAAADRFVDLAGLLESSEVGDFRADFLSWGHHRPEYWRNYWYSHSFHEVCLAYAGSGRFNSGSVRYDVEPDSVFLARPGDVHEIESSRVDPLGIAFWGFTFRPSTAAVDPNGPGWWSGLTRTDGPVMSSRVGGLPSVVAALAAEAAAPRSGYDESLAAFGAALVGHGPRICLGRRSPGRSAGAGPRPGRRRGDAATWTTRTDTPTASTIPEPTRPPTRPNTDPCCRPPSIEERGNRETSPVGPAD